MLKVLSLRGFPTFAQCAAIVVPEPILSGLDLHKMTFNSNSVLGTIYIVMMSAGGGANTKSLI